MCRRSLLCFLLQVQLQILSVLLPFVKLPGAQDAFLTAAASEDIEIAKAAAIHPDSKQLRQPEVSFLRSYQEIKRMELLHCHGTWDRTSVGVLPSCYSSE